jgi:hypothetical protein
VRVGVRVGVDVAVGPGVYVPRGVAHAPDRGVAAVPGAVDEPVKSIVLEPASPKSSVCLYVTLTDTTGPLVGMAAAVRTATMATGTFPRSDATAVATFP